VFGRGQMPRERSWRENGWIDDVKDSVYFYIGTFVISGAGRDI